tara:strand:- start:436 stop:1350 length:915 start_codon:yes stop_codon:yes gene_type:complete
MAVTKGKFPDAINPIFRAMMEEPFDGEGLDIVKELYDTDTSTRPEERLTSISGLPKFPKFTGTLVYKDPVQGYDVTATHVTYAMGVQITRETWDDDQHGQIKRIFEGFKDAAWETRQDDGAQILNNAFVNDTEFYNHTEAVALCSNSHTSPDGDVSTSSGFDNLSTTSLSATALSAARYTMRLFKDFKGIRIDKVPDTLIVPAELDDEALKIVQTKVGLDTAAGDANVQAGRFRVVSSTRLTDTNNYFVTNSGIAKKSFIWYDRVPYETDRMESFDQFNFKGRAYMRYSYLWLCWQGILGFQVS